VRILALAVSAVLAAAAFVAADVRPCRADATGVAPAWTAAPSAERDGAPQPGTEDEERAYARRESESPAAQEFAGGWVLEFLVVVALVVVIVLLIEKI
jgi:cobalamin biosynthesis Mg chelatase CobN